MKWLALHGVPTHPALFSRVPAELEPWAFRGLGTPDPRDDWSLESFVAEARERWKPGMGLIGHDLGGVVAAMLALEVPAERVVLSGTALGPYWSAIRMTAWPGLQRFFYQRYGGRRFLAGGVLPDNRDAFLETFAPHLDTVPDLSDRMRTLARHMRPPAELARALGARAEVSLVWGRHDRWYPRPVVAGLQRATGADVTWLDASHFCMWEQPEAFATVLSR